MRHLARAIAGSACLALGGCSGWQSALDPHGVQAQHLSRLIWSITAVCTVVWLLVIAMLLASLTRRRRQERLDPVAVDAAVERRLRLSVGSAVAATAAIICGLALTSYFTTRSLGASRQDALAIDVRAYQWWWEVTYVDPATGDRIKTANEIHVPAGRPVRIALSAADVIHSFWVPNLAGKQDLLPGRNTSIEFTALEPGLYRGQCAEFCGLQHAHMAFDVLAQSPDEFDAWLAAQAKAGDAPSGTLEAAGLRTFLAKPCASCHTVRGTAAAGTTGPDLTHVGSRRTIAAGLFETTRGTMAAWIADPQTLKPGNNMPLVPLGADELKAVSAYLMSLR